MTMERVHYLYNCITLSMSILLSICIFISIISIYVSIALIFLITYKNNYVSYHLENVIYLDLWCQYFSPTKRTIFKPIDILVSIWLKIFISTQIQCRKQNLRGECAAWASDITARKNLLPLLSIWAASLSMRVMDKNGHILSRILGPESVCRTVFSFPASEILTWEQKRLHGLPKPSTRQWVQSISLLLNTNICLSANTAAFLSTNDQWPGHPKEP